MVSEKKQAQKNGRYMRQQNILSKVSDLHTKSLKKYIKTYYDPREGLRIACKNLLEVLWQDLSRRFANNGGCNLEEKGQLRISEGGLFGSFFRLFPLPDERISNWTGIFCIKMAQTKRWNPACEKQKKKIFPLANFSSLSQVSNLYSSLKVAKLPGNGSLRDFRNLH